MDKELLNKILPYCGHGLKAIYEDDIVDVCISSSGTRRISTEHLLTKSRDGIYHYKPVLFPPVCLTEEIETEHGKEVPWIELSKIVYETIRTRYSKIKDIKLMTEITTTYTEITSNHDVTYIFQYDCIYAWFCLTCGRLNITFNPVPVLNYLYSRHIAFNLEPDEYVSVESLEKNPYAV